MRPATLLYDLIALSAERRAEAVALGDGRGSMNYGELQAAVIRFSNGLLGLGLLRGERVGIYLEKRFESVIAAFGTAAAGGAFVPINPLLKPTQVQHILRDCNVRVLVTSRERLSTLGEVPESCPDLRQVVLVNGDESSAQCNPYSTHSWNELLTAPARPGHRMIDCDMATILYTSGSTGKPKGVVLSHRNLVAGAHSVASYLENNADDALLAALPLSFDAGFSQLTTAFHAGARVVLLNYLLPRDVLKALERERITGLTAVPPLYIQLAQYEWPAGVNGHLRYFASTGGRMPLETLAAIRAQVPSAKPFVMYGLTEAFRSTYLPPEEVDRRPGSIGKAIPNAEILVLHPDGSPCSANVPGELVHRGPLVAQGYWNDPGKTAERFKPLPKQESGHVLPEIAVFSGDTVRMDEEGFLYFIGRNDEMIKTSGYRVSPTEVEEIVDATGLVGECAAVGIEDPVLGQAITLFATAPSSGTVNPEQLLAECRRRMPAYMVPARIHTHPGPLPRNPNGKVDRHALAAIADAGPS